MLSAEGDPALPAGVVPLAQHVSAPPALARRLAQIGVVARDDGKALQAHLRPGQRLVSVEGDLWRWDGFCLAAEAPTPAARRLAEKNRLGDLTRDAELARQVADELKAKAETVQADLRAKADAGRKPGKRIARPARRRRRARSRGRGRAEKGTGRGAALGARGSGAAAHREP